MKLNRQRMYFAQHDPTSWLISISFSGFMLFWDLGRCEFSLRLASTSTLRGNEVEFFLSNFWFDNRRVGLWTVLKFTLFCTTSRDEPLQDFWSSTNSVELIISQSGVATRGIWDLRGFGDDLDDNVILSRELSLEKFKPLIIVSRCGSILSLWNGWKQKKM